MPLWSNKFLLPLRPITLLEDSQDTTATTAATTSSSTTTNISINNNNKMYTFSKSIIHGFKTSNNKENSSDNNNYNYNSPEDSPFSSHELKRFLRPGAISKLKPTSPTSTSGSLKTIPRVKNLEPVIKPTKVHEEKLCNINEIGDHVTHTKSHSTVLELEDIKDKYGEIGKLLGSGANGSVHIITRQSDHIKFAIKQFRARQYKESNTHYFKRCNQEYLIGSSLKHCNIVDIIDFIMIKDESSNATSNYLYYEIMEFLPIDLFNVVMSNDMSRFEINCCFKQLLEAVTFLHEQGIAHRDLKLDNCCMTSDGILKLIDFGSSFVFQYPFEPQQIMATGVMGSDPYLSPELYSPDNKGFTQDEYNAAKVDIWSLAIIYCCMILRRFPWKCPRSSDLNFKTFLMPDNEPHDYSTSATTHEQLVEKRRHLREIGEDPSQIKFPDHLRQKIHPKDLHGPYKLFRLLPHGCRPIISQMMAISPQERPTMKQIMQDSWVQNIDNCTVDALTKKTLRAKGHHHTVVIDDIPSYKV
ncbi:hypothetical protein MOUN0_I05028 [Monosporozyma unispora]|nr:serine/threonine protein kinase [Kazachstania unispora]